MSHRSIATACALALILALPGVASAELKVGFVDTRRGVMSTDLGKEMDATLTKLAEDKRQEVEPAQKEFQQKQEELESQRFVLSKEALNDRLLDLQKRQRELERDLAAARDDFEVQQRKMLAPILKKFEQAVTDVGKEKGFDVILDRSVDGILYYKPALDITDLVVQRINKGS